MLPGRRAVAESRRVGMRLLTGFDRGLGMAKGYRPVNRDQGFLLPPDMREWLGGDHPVWLVIRVVEEHLDTGGFHARRRTGGAGAAGYDPDMLVTVLVWAYAHGCGPRGRSSGCAGPMWRSG